MWQKSKLTSLNQFKIILWFDALVSGSRMLIGATSALFLISVGMHPKDVMILKAFQAFVMLVLEIPLGYLADVVNRKLVIVFGTICCFLWLFFTGSAQNVVLLYVGELFNALSLATFSGAVESEYIRQWEKYYPQKPLYSAFGILTKYSFTTTSIAALSGGIISPPGSRIVWFVAAGLILFLMLSFMFLYQGESKKIDLQQGIKWQEHLHHLVTIIRNSHKNLIIPILCMALLNSGFQIAIQYWQIQIPINISNKYAGTILGIIFLLIMLVQSRPEKLAHYLFKKPYLYLLALFVPSLIWTFTVNLNSFYLIALGTIMYFWFYQATSLDLSSEVNLNTEDSSRATMLSVRSTLVRVFVLAVTPLVNLAVKNYQGVGAIYLVSLIAILATLLIWLSGTYTKMFKYRLTNSR